MNNTFIIRVYGILIKEKQVLVADEYVHGSFITKFPGGGLQYGEGTCDGLIREFKEELNIDVYVREHFYTTDFFLPSAFDPSQQVISIYYLVEASDVGRLNISEPADNKDNLQEGYCAFRWLSLESVTEDAFTFPADKKVASLLRKAFHL
jgi:ADP-ribose pyrophosphatase YjhB (NUDIX family)